MLPAHRESRWAVETHGLTKRFGVHTPVNDVELLVPRGSAFGYLGPNGAGKTTLMRVLLGLTQADAGAMSLLGYPVPRRRDAALARIGAIVDEPRFHSHLSGRQNLRLLAAAREPAARDRIGPALERVGLAHRADDRVAKYSLGMRQRLGVAACLLGDPDLLILDEPMNGLDPAGIAGIRDMILSLVADGRTVVLCSHLLDEVERTCDTVAIVDRGRIIEQGPISELLAGATLVLRRGRNLHLPAPAGTDLARIVVPAGHDQAGGLAMTTGPPDARPRDRRGSPIPTLSMIGTRAMELRRRRGLMIALIAVNIGLPALFLVIRLLLHAFAPRANPPAGSELIFGILAAGFLPTFGFIVAITVGCTAGSRDLTEGMFRHLVVTRRSPS
jgi:ABC-type multidrug transport system ATPase subunit